MKNKKLHKLDLMFLVGIGIIGTIGGMTDVFNGKNINFPVYSCISAYISYALWIILLIYSFLKYKEKEDKPKYVRWFMYFILPFLHIAFVIIGFIISGLIINVLVL